MLQCPSSFFGVDEQGSEEKVEALKIKMMRFLKKVQRKQNAIKNTVKKIVQWVMTLSGVEKEFAIEVKFSDDMFIDKQKQFENFVLMNENWLLSKKSTIWYVLDRDEESVDKELALIKEEKDALITTKPNGDTIPGKWGNKGADDKGTI